MSSFDYSVQCEETFQPMRMVWSDCCGEYMSHEHEQYGSPLVCSRITKARSVCPCCKEHCDAIVEDIMVCD